MHCVDVANFVYRGFGVWLLRYSTLGRRTMVHSRVPNSDEHTKVE